MKEEKIKKVLLRRLAALEEWDFNLNSQLEDVKSKDEAQALGHWWEIISIADELRIKLK